MFDKARLTAGAYAVLMEAVVALFSGRGEGALRALAAQAGAHVNAMHPGARDAEGQRWWLLSCADEPALLALVQALRQHVDVEAAYTKPEGSTPHR